jgi:hypothetical protein
MTQTDDGGAEVTLYDGRTVQVPKQIRMQIDSVRGMNEAQKQASIGKKQREEDERAATNKAVGDAQEKAQRAIVEKRGGGQPESYAAVPRSTRRAVYPGSGKAGRHPPTVVFESCWRMTIGAERR